MSLRDFRKAGHPPTLLSAFLYFDVSFMVWVILGPLGPFDLLFVAESSASLLVGFLAFFTLSASLLPLLFGPSGVGFLDFVSVSGELLLEFGDLLLQFGDLLVEFGIFPFELVVARLIGLVCGQCFAADSRPAGTSRDGVDGVHVDSL